MNKKRSLRLTRRSYRRKLVMFGVSIFMSLALVSTGFAAWVLSKDTAEQIDGEVEIGSVTEASVEIKDIIFAEKDQFDQPIKTFVFEPVAEDNAGRVRWDKTHSEDLDIKISFTVVNYQIVGDLFVDFKISKDIKNAIDNNYIELPAEFVFQQDKDGFITEEINGETYYVARYDIGNAIESSGGRNDGILTKYTVTTANGVETVVFEMTLKFKWGTYFDGMNPSVYYDKSYDETDKGANIPYDTVKADLNKFKAMIHGITFENTDKLNEFVNKSEAEKEAIYAQNPVDKYIAVINATVA